MPKYRIKLSDGRTFDIEASGPPSEDDVLGALGSHTPASEPKAPIPEPSAGGMVGNAIDDAMNVGGSLPGALGHILAHPVDSMTAIPVGMLNRIKDVASDIHPKEAFSQAMAGRPMAAIGNMLPVGELYQRPVSAAMDAVGGASVLKGIRGAAAIPDTAKAFQAGRELKRMSAPVEVERFGPAQTTPRPTAAPSGVASSRIPYRSNTTDIPAQGGTALDDALASQLSGLPEGHAKIPFKVADAATQRMLETGVDYSKPTLERVPLDKLTATQPTVTRATVEKHLGGPSATLDGLPVGVYGRPQETAVPNVFKGEDGSYYLGGGHHRATAAFERGDADIQAITYPLKAAKSAQEGAPLDIHTPAADMGRFKLPETNVPDEAYNIAREKVEGRNAAERRMVVGQAPGGVERRGANANPKASPSPSPFSGDLEPDWHAYPDDASRKAAPAIERAQANALHRETGEMGSRFGHLMEDPSGSVPPDLLGMLGRMLVQEGSRRLKKAVAAPGVVRGGMLLGKSAGEAANVGRFADYRE